MKYTPAFLLLACLWLGGCGQKGPLYLPQPEQPPAATGNALDDGLDKNPAENPN